MNINEKNKLSRGALIEKEKAVVERICKDDNFAYYFFHEKCRPLFSKIMWTIFGNNTDYDELINDLYVLLKKPNSEGEEWHALKTYDYRTTLFDWIKTVAVRHFYNSKNETVGISTTFTDTKILEDIIREMSKAVYRKYMRFKYIKLLSKEELATLLEVNETQLKSLGRKAEKQFKTLVEHSFPEYYDVLFPTKNTNDIDIDDVGNKLPIDPNNDVRIDINRYLQAMPNERYRYVIDALFLKDIEPEELATEMNTPISNIYNIKKRALDQLRDLAIYFNEISNLEKYIYLISDDIKREILYSLFVERKSYEAVCSKMDITEVKLKKIKKEAMKELRNIIF